MRLSRLFVFACLLLSSSGLWAANGADIARAESNAPTSLSPGQVYRVRIRAYNTGTTTWTALSNFRLGAGSGNSVTWSNFGCNGYSLSANNARAYLCNNV